MRKRRGFILVTLVAGSTSDPLHGESVILSTYSILTVYPYGGGSVIRFRDTRNPDMYVSETVEQVYDMLPMEPEC